MYSLLQGLKIVKKLGFGATGEVALVDHGGELRALKVINLNAMSLLGPRGGIAKDERQRKLLRERKQKFLLAGFQYEAKTLKTLDHVNVTRFYDCGYAAKEKRYYLISEYVEGKDLYTAVKDLSFNEKELVFIDILRGLNYLHNQAVYHFDLKVQNILVNTCDGKLVPKIIDFGLANFHLRPEYLAETPDDESHQSTAQLGTPTYMAPEVWLGEDKDGRSDLYSLGVIFYYCLTGELPFKCKDLSELKDLHCNFKPQNPCFLNKDIPEYWDRIIMRLLEKNPNNRYHDAAFVIREICLYSNQDYKIETTETQISYLPRQGRFIGRENEIRVFNEVAKKVFTDKDEKACRLLVVKGKKGTGKTRLLDEIKFFGKLHYNLAVQTWDKIDDPVHSPTIIILDQTEADSRNVVLDLLLKHAGKEVLVVSVEADPDFTWEQSQEIILKDFTKNHISDYIKQVIRSDEPPQFIVDQLYDQTGGNPFLLSRLIQHLLEQNIMVDASGPWPTSLLEDLAIDIREVRTSQTFEDFYVDELKKLNLTDIQERILNFMALINKAVDEKILSNVIGYSEITTDLYPLVKKHKILNQDLAGMITFCKKSFLEFIANHIPFETKCILHQSIADYLKNNHGDKKQIAWHQGCARAKFKEASIILLDLAGEYEKAGKYKKAVVCYDKLLDLKEGGEALAVAEVEQKLVTALFHSNKFKRAKEIADKIVGDLRGLKPCPIKERILWEISYINLGMSLQNADLLDCEKYLKFISDQLASYLKLPENKAKNIFFSNRQAQVEVLKGNLDKAEAIFTATAMAELGLSTTEKEFMSNNDLNKVLYLKKEYEKAKQVCNERLKIISNPNQKGRCYYLLALVLNQMGLHDEAISNLEKCDHIAKENQDMLSLLRVFNLLGDIYYSRSKNLDASKSYWERALILAQKNNDLTSCGAIASNLGRVFNHIKQYNDAFHYLIYSIRCFDSLKSKLITIADQIVRAKIELVESAIGLNDLKVAQNFLNDIKNELDLHNELSHLTFWYYCQCCHYFHVANDTANKTMYLENAKKRAHTELEKNTLKNLQALSALS
ncbi:MAG: protein kinase [Deltaproteobacteria bacterium]|nr:protein kinase [Deltaproteobacteria bacterium]